MRWTVLILATCAWALIAGASNAAEPLRVGVFQVDATPPLGSPLCDSLVPPASEIVDPLSARGIVLLSDEPPIVLCAVDWVGIGNGGYRAWREALARAAGTTPSRVAVHCLHQHDAPGCDFDAEDLLAMHGMSGVMFHVAFARQTIDAAADAVRGAVESAVPVTHVGAGLGRVEQVASTRRVMGADGKVKHVRYSSCRDEAVRAEPEGTIDPDVRLVSFWNGDEPIAALTYYATHPQSYYGQGGVSCDFVGLARAAREQDAPQLAHIHFNGAGGNVTAGKYNDGEPATRPLLAARLAAGMKAAWDNTHKTPVTADQAHWLTRSVALPASPLANEKQWRETLANSAADSKQRVQAARNLIWLRRCETGEKIELSCLRLGPIALLHMPGELFVEYELAAEQMRPDLTVCMAAYGDYGMGYIGTQIAYSQGGYETGPVSRVAPEVEGVLMTAVRELLADAP